MNEPNQEPLENEKTNEPNQELLDHEKINEPNKEPMNNDKKNEQNQEPSNQDKKNELNNESLDHDKKNEPDQESLDHDKSADQLGSSPNFVKKNENVVQNAADYLQSNGSQTFIWGRTDIDPENNADVNTGEGQHPTNGPNAEDEMDLLTTIQITKKQIDKRLQCTICLDEYELGEEAMELTCGHIFHERCITHWIIVHGTCPVCRRYFCPVQLHLPKERVSLFRSIVRRVCRTICSPLFYFFPSLRIAQAMNHRRRGTAMYRLVEAERVISLQESARRASADIIEGHMIFPDMIIIQYDRNEQYPRSFNTVAANMRRRFSHLLRKANVNPAAAGENPPPRRPEFQAGAENPPAERPEFPFPLDYLSTV